MPRFSPSKIIELEGASYSLCSFMPSDSKDFNEGAMILLSSFFFR
jgi:hypothetical protein